MTEQTYTAILLTPLRKVIASRMVEAKQTIPHYRLSADIQMDALLSVRKEWNAENPNHKLSVNDFIIKACASALIEVPKINIQLVESEIHQYSQADISVVIAVEGGLSTPIIRNANTKSVQEISREIKILAERAANNSLKLFEIHGGTFSISNLGMYEVEQFDAIINPPQCAILAVATTKSQPIVHDGEIVAATLMRLNLSLDHRAIDGVDGAKFMAAVKKHLEDPQILINSETE